MKPAVSVILFTVLSGAGLGLLIWLCLAVLSGAPLSPAEFNHAALLAVLLVTVGLLCSTGHLANPRNAWQSFRRFGSSWLSREAVFAILLYPLLLWFGAALHGYAPGLSLAAGLLVVDATAILLCTAMIYACLRTVPHWNNWQTRIGLPLLGLMSGGVLLLALWPLQLVNRPILLFVLVLLAAGLLLKYHYYTHYRQIAATAPSLNESLQLGIEPSTAKVNARVRLLDVGHAHGTFLTREFGYEVPRQRRLQLRLLALAAGFAAPFALLLWWPGLAPLAAIICLAGLLVERWLFFAEARHVVRRYHDLPME